MTEHKLDDVLDNMCKCLRNNLDRPLPESMSADTRLVADLHLDSLEGLQLLADLEDHYGIALGVSVLRGVQTLGDVAHVVQSALNTGRQA